MLLFKVTAVSHSRTRYLLSAVHRFTVVMRYIAQTLAEHLLVPFIRYQKVKSKNVVNE